MKKVRMVLLMCLFAAIAFAKTPETNMTLNVQLSADKGKIDDAKVNQETLTLHCKPLYDASGKAIAMRVSFQVPFDDSLHKHSLDLYLDLMQNLGRETDQVSQLSATDEQGAVPFDAFRIDKENNAQIWHASREVIGVTNIAYTISTANPDRVGGSNIDMQASGDGLTGSFISIVLLPKFQKDRLVKIVWDLQPGTQAISTFGAVNVTSETPVGYYELLYAQFIVGKLTTYPNPLPKTGFSIAGLGLSKSQVGNSLPVYQKVYEQLRKDLNGSREKAFRFFFRSFDSLPFSSGTATNASKSGSFILYIPPSETLNANEEMLSLVAHEMVHVFLRGIPNHDWYNEGIADYLSATLPYKANYYSKKEYLKIVNTAYAQYFGNPQRLIPDSAALDTKFSSAMSWTLSYSRGMIYFANLDAKLRNKLKNKNITVRSLVLDIHQMSMKQEITEDTWVALLRKKAGEWAVDDWKYMKSGKLIVPESDSYGSEFMVEKVPFGYFDLGFKSPGSIVKNAVIKGLDQNSNAAKAGLKNGDKIVESVDLISIFGTFDKELNLKVERDGKILNFSYLPRSGSVEAWKFKEVSP